MSTARVITKYPNRRLYDTERSHYITLADIRNLILEQVEFAVIDKKSGLDITRTILLQVITDLEQHGQAIMTRDFLAQVIQSYGKAAPGVIGQHLEQSLKSFISIQETGTMAQISGGEPAAPVDGAEIPGFGAARAVEEARKKAS
jgi:polyhydroxyalkanoate synthesis repressor PhaR